MKTTLLLLLLFLGGGAVLSPWAARVEQEEVSLHLLPSVFEEKTGEKSQRLEQQLSLVSLGGLRSLVAAFLSIGSYDDFSQRRWGAVEDRFRQIVALAPQNKYYWDTGAWHLAYNASSDSAEDKSLRATEREIRRKQYIAKGKRFLEQGIAHNSRDWVLYARLGNLLSDAWKQPEYKKAAEMFGKAVALGAPDFYQRSEMYALARVPEEEEKAYEMGLKLYQNPENRVPSLRSLLFVLGRGKSSAVPIRQMFSSPKTAYWSMENYHYRQMEYPQKGVKEVLDLLKPYKESRSWELVPYSCLEKLDK